MLPLGHQKRNMGFLMKSKYVPTVSDGKKYDKFNLVSYSCILDDLRTT